MIMDKVQSFKSIEELQRGLRELMSGGKDQNMDFEKPDLSEVNQYIYDKVTAWLTSYIPKLEGLSKDQQDGLIKNIQEEMK
jgi:hypothetical protein